MRAEPGQAVDTRVLGRDESPVLRPNWAMRLCAGGVAAFGLGAEAVTRGELATAAGLLGLFGLYAAAITLVSLTTSEGRGLLIGIALVMCLEVAMLTAALLALGHLQGPLVGIYGLFVLGAGIWAGLRAGVAVAVASLAAYGAALILAGIEPAAAWRSLLLGLGVIAAGLFLCWTGVKLIRARAGAAESRYRMLFDAASDPIVVWDPSNTSIIDVNVAGELAAGLPREQILGSTGLQFIPIEQRPEVEARFQTGAYLKGPATHRYVRPDGEERFFKVSASPFQLDGRPAVVAIVSDLTDRYRLEQEQRRHAEDLEREVEARTIDLERANRQLRELQSRLVQAQRLSAAEDLAGSVVHAINNPLTALMGTVQLALEGSSPDPTFERVLRLAHRIREVVDRTLGLFRSGALNLRLEAPGDLIERVRDELAPQLDELQLGAELKVGSDLPRVLVDRELLTAALVGIAENAVEASSGGQIWLEAEVLPAAKVLRLCISDEGSGIRPELRARVFDPFFTTKPGGTGLGLAIARGVIHGHRGTVRIEDRPGGGTSIAVELPVEPDA